MTRVAPSALPRSGESATSPASEKDEPEATALPAPDRVARRQWDGPERLPDYLLTAPSVTSFIEALPHDFTVRESVFPRYSELALDASR